MIQNDQTEAQIAAIRREATEKQAAIWREADIQIEAIRRKIQGEIP